MAVAIYLLVIGGYLFLGTPQHYAAFVAFIMCVMLALWVRHDAQQCLAYQLALVNAISDLHVDSVQGRQSPSLAASIMKLDALKSELVDQYAQFGRDQSALNSNSLGNWHRRSGLNENEH